ncbi:hypothetical protein [Micromonospora sp. NPDC049799]|uniref:hypothetical protein n=1 Tax=Micromonospora sp. NPDC049799 TaxID=3154741 RepID=UPI003400C724
MSIDQGWVPQACTLPTREQPLRLAQFDELFATALHGQRRLAPTVLRWRLDPSAEHAARDLTARESDCCSFFTFAVTRSGDSVEIEVQVPDSHIAVLDALVARAAARLPT